MATTMFDIICLATGDRKHLYHTYSGYIQFKYIPRRDITIILENVEHCGGEPEQADRILMSDVTYSTFGVQCKLTQWNPH